MEKRDNIVIENYLMTRIVFDTNDRTVIVVIIIIAFDSDWYFLVIFFDFLIFTSLFRGARNARARSERTSRERVTDKNNAATVVMVVRSLIVAILVTLFSRDTHSSHLYDIIFVQNNARAYFIILNIIVVVVIASSHDIS